MTDDSGKRSIPSWQQSASTTATSQQDAKEGTTKSSSDSQDLIDVARDFLKDESIRDAPWEDKVQFLKEKGLSDSAVEKLLAEDLNSANELKTVHDTSEKQKPEQQKTDEDTQQKILSATPSQQVALPETRTVQASDPRPEMAPIITYPEFLLKPQKPPPLITVSQLVNAAYALAGVSALTWGASKYIVDPMLQTLTEARHSLADGTLEDMEKLNEKLEGMVSHIPYIASSAVKRAHEKEDDLESVDSDPTELFHRDIATQTTPNLSRSASNVSLSRHTLDPTIAQSERLAGLSYSLRSLVQSLDHTNDNEKHLQDTVKDFQQKIDYMDSSYSMLKNDFYSSTSIYSSASNDAKKATRENEAQKFKQEIRSLKGAFLSSRNFPTPPRPTAVAGGYGSR